MEKITLKKIAELAGVSSMTVSNVVRGRDKEVSTNTKNKILALIDEYKYVPDQNASSLRTGKSSLIGVLFYNQHRRVDFADPFTAALLTGINQVARERGYFTIVDFLQSPDSIERLQRNWNLAGFIVVGLQSPDFFDIDQAIMTPVSYVDSYWLENQELAPKPRNYIQTDEEKISQEIARHLNQKGHENVLFYSFDFKEGVPSVDQKRYQAFKKAFSGEVKYLFTSTPEYSEILKSLSSYLEERPFTAIYADADILAVNLYRIFGDLSIIGVDNAEFDEFVSPKLSTVAIDQEEKGKIALELLLDSIENGTSASYISDVKLIERDSVRKIK